MLLLITKYDVYFKTTIKETRELCMALTNSIYFLKTMWKKREVDGFERDYLKQYILLNQEKNKKMKKGRKSLLLFFFLFFSCFRRISFNQL